MACNKLTGFTQDSCLSNIGGIKRVWLAEYVDGAAETATTSGITSVTGFTTGITWQEFPLKKNSAQATSEYQIGDGGSVFVQTTLEMNFNRQDANKRMAMVSLAGNELIAVYEDANGNRWFLGKDNPVSISAGGGETGTQKTDVNKYSVSLQIDIKLFIWEKLGKKIV